MANPTATPPRRRWLRYSLRGLLLLMTLVAVALGFGLNDRNSYFRQAKALGKLRELKFVDSGGYFTQQDTWRRWLIPQDLACHWYKLRLHSGDDRIFEYLPHISCYTVYIEAPDFDDEDLRRLVSCAPELNTLVLRKSNVTTAGLAALRKSPALENLSLGDICNRHVQQKTGPSRDEWFQSSADQFGDDALKIAGELSKLRQLRVISSKLGNQKLALLSASSHLQELVLVSPQLDDNCLPEIAKLNELRSLFLGEGTFTSAGIDKLQASSKLQLLAFRNGSVDRSALASIAKLPALEFLLLDNVGVKSDDLSALAGAPKLWDIFLAGPGLDNGLLQNLQGVKSLHHLHMYGTAVDEAGLDDVLALRSLNEIFVTPTQLSSAAKKKLNARKPSVVVFDQAHNDDPPILFFGPGLNWLHMWEYW